MKKMIQMGPGKGTRETSAPEEELEQVTYSSFKTLAVDLHHKKLWRQVQRVPCPARKWAPACSYCVQRAKEMPEKGHRRQYSPFPYSAAVLHGDERVAVVLTSTLFFSRKGPEILNVNVQGSARLF